MKIKKTHTNFHGFFALLQSYSGFSVVAPLVDFFLKLGVCQNVLLSMCVKFG